jgi:hypothetical protein
VLVFTFNDAVAPQLRERVAEWRPSSTASTPMTSGGNR